MMARGDFLSKEHEMRCAIIMLELQRSLHPSSRHGCNPCHHGHKTPDQPLSTAFRMRCAKTKTAVLLRESELSKEHYLSSPEAKTTAASREAQGVRRRTKIAGNSEVPSFGKSCLGPEGGKHWQAVAGPQGLDEGHPQKGRQGRYVGSSPATASAAREHF